MKYGPHLREADAVRAVDPDQAQAQWPRYRGARRRASRGRGARAEQRSLDGPESTLRLVARDVAGAGHRAVRSGRTARAARA